MLLFLMIAASSAAVTLFGESRKHKKTTTRTTRAVSLSLPASEKIKHLGVQSCAAANCHGGKTDQNNPARKNKGAEYSLWILSDPHAHALSTLYNKESQHIFRQLKKSPTYRNLLPPHQAPLCLNCHSSPTTADGNLATLYERGNVENNNERNNQAIFRDGIGCEACHGPSEQWLEPHKRPDWHLTVEQKNNSETVLADLNKKTDLGFQNTKDIVTRGRICANCHVGGPGREVNHDLIAAGHPRLNFELSVYLARMPHHWSHDDEPNTEFLTWAAGQLITAEASLDLLERRADGNMIWPELAESDCFACHHDLQASSWRQETADSGNAPGHLRWASWNSAMLPTLANFASHPEKDQIRESLNSIQTLMGQPLPPSRKVSETARTLRTEILLPWETNLRELSGNKNAGINLLKQICQTDGPKLVANGWDSASQVYLSLMALVRDDRQRVRKSSADKTRSNHTVDQALEQFRLLLEFPKKYDSPKQAVTSQAKELHKLSTEKRIEEIKKVLGIIFVEYSKPNE